MRTQRLTSEPARRKSLPRKIFVVFLGLSCGVPALARADQVLLKNGNRLEGRVTDAGPGRIRIELDAGSSIEIDLDQVAERIPGKAPIEVFPERLRAIEGGDRDGYVELARWGEERGIKRRARDAWREVLRLDPHHTTARSRLGYALHRNRWVKREDLEGAGLTLFRGEWMTPERVAEVKAEERAAELDALLDDAAHDNPFVRENAMHQLLTVDDPALIPALRKRLGHDDPLRRMWAGRILANFSFDEWGAPLYAAFLVEPRQEVRSAWTAVLRSSRDPRVGTWLARDLAAPGSDPTRNHSLLGLVKVCPTRAVVLPLIGWVDDPAWGTLAVRALEGWFGARGTDAATWGAWWGSARAEVPADLGTGWLGPDPR